MEISTACNLILTGESFLGCAGSELGQETQSSDHTSYAEALMQPWLLLGKMRSFCDEVFSYGVQDRLNLQILGYSGFPQ